MEKIKKKFIEHPILRWLMLILVGFVLATNYYFYDAFSTLKDLMQVNKRKKNNTIFGIFHNLFSNKNFLIFRN